MKTYLDFDYKLRPLRAAYILILAGLVFWASDSVAASLITLMAVIDIEDRVGKD